MYQYFEGTVVRESGGAVVVKNEGEVREQSITLSHPPLIKKRGPAFLAVLARNKSDAGHAKSARAVRLTWVSE